MKKKIIIGVFSFLILVTAIFFLVAAIKTYNVAVANEDILAWLGAVMALAIGCSVVFYELDLFHTIYYFLVKPKTITKSILNILSNIILLSMVFTNYIADILYTYVSEAFAEEVIVWYALLLTYIVLRVVCAMVPIRQKTKED